MNSEITKPANKQELSKALNQRGWKFLETHEVVNPSDVRALHSHAGSLVAKGKKLCVVLIERD